ncbi:MAG: YaaC family protein [Fusobacteriaceae bacterium]
MNKIEYIYTENPIEEQWRQILHFSYPNNIKSYFNKKGIKDVSEKIIENISGSILQSKEYFDNFKNSSLQIKPLLLYYGVTNLFNAFSILLSNTIPEIKNHGMQLKIADYKKIADLKINPVNEKDGALGVFNKIFSGDLSKEKLTEYGEWSLLELFSSIYDVSDDFKNCYEYGETHVIPVKIIKMKTYEVEKIKIEDIANQDNFFKQIKNYKEVYLSPEKINKDNSIILKKKMYKKTLAEQTVFGNYYFSLSHFKKSSYINPILEIRLYMILYGLSVVSRYNPEIWNPFLKNDITGEKLLIEKLLNFSSRIIPNLLLNKLYDSKFIYVQNYQGIVDLSQNLSKEDIKELIKDELRKTK